MSSTSNHSASIVNNRKSSNPNEQQQVTKPNSAMSEIKTSLDTSSANDISDKS